jgi:hypothetical protein
MDVDTSKWSGEGGFTEVVIDQLKQIAGIADIRVEDAPASRSEADYNFVSNEIFVAFATSARCGWLLGRLWHRLLGRPASEPGRLCHGDEGHD